MKSIERQAFYNLKELQGYLFLPYNAIKRLAKHGLIKTVKIGRNIYINENDIPEQFFEVSEIALKLSLTETTIRSNLRAGKLFGYKIGKNWYIPESSLHAYLAGYAFDKDKKPQFIYAITKESKDGLIEVFQELEYNSYSEAMNYYENTIVSICTLNTGYAMNPTGIYSIDDSEYIYYFGKKQTTCKIKGFTFKLNDIVETTMLLRYNKESNTNQKEKKA